MGRSERRCGRDFRVRRDDEFIAVTSECDSRVDAATEFDSVPISLSPLIAVSSSGNRKTGRSQSLAVCETQCVREPLFQHFLLRKQVQVSVCLNVFAEQNPRPCSQFW